MSSAARPPGRRRRLLVVAVLLLGLVAWVVAVPRLSGWWTPEPAPQRATTAARAHQPRLIKHGWDIPSPQFVHDHLDAMLAMPFDGLTISLPGGLGSRVQRQTPVSLEEFRIALAPLQGLRLGHLSHNFVVVYATPAGDVFGDYSVPVANFARLAQAAREVGLEGVMYDNEEYSGGLTSYPRDCPGHSLDACRTRAIARGQLVMNAMRAQWPDIQVITLFGPWVSDPRTPTALGSVLSYRDASSGHELMGPFVVGMVAATMGTPARLIDGGEIYTARTRAQFEAVRAWQKVGVASPGGLVPPRLRARWANAVSSAFGVYDEPWQGIGVDPDSFSSTVQNALTATDEYVWVYTERYDWWGTGWPRARVPADWVAAVRSARAAVRSDAPGSAAVLRVDGRRNPQGQRLLSLVRATRPARTGWPTAEPRGEKTRPW